MKVRDKLPIRRAIPSKNPSKDWGLHKQDLKKDFHSHCAYCGTYDGFRHTYFEVDHFVPKKLLIDGCGISICQYDNLVYSCKFCNNIKWNQWPTEDITRHNDGRQGYIDPCDAAYDEHIHRTPDGRIRGESELGKWMVEVGFKFNRRDDAIKVLWELNEIRKNLNLLIDKIEAYPAGTEESERIKAKVHEFSFRYYILHRELQDYYDNR